MNESLKVCHNCTFELHKTRASSIFSSKSDPMINLIAIGVCARQKCKKKLKWCHQSNQIQIRVAGTGTERGPRVITDLS